MQVGMASCYTSPAVTAGQMTVIWTVMTLYFARRRVLPRYCTAKHPHAVSRRRQFIGACGSPAIHARWGVCQTSVETVKQSEAR